MGAAAGVGGAVEVEGGVAGLRGWSVPAWGGLVVDGARPPQALETPAETPIACAWYWRTIEGSALVVPDGEP